MKKGFTLIELMVVVVIIGALSAIAVPQYLRAVERARASEALTYNNAIAKALVTWRAEHGSCTGDITQLPLDMAFPGGSDTVNNVNRQRTDRFAFLTTTDCIVVGTKWSGNNIYSIVTTTLNSAGPGVGSRGKSFCRGPDQICQQVTSNTDSNACDWGLSTILGNDGDCFPF